MAAAAGNSRQGFLEAVEQRAPRGRSLSRESIVETALGIVDAEGLDALSMRRIAQELNTGPASLYAYVPSKELLVALVLDRVAADLVLPVPDADHWQQQVRDFLRQSRNNLAAHNDLARALLLADLPMLPRQLEAAEAMVALLRAGGLPDQVIACGVDLMRLHAVSSACQQSRRGGPQAPTVEGFDVGLDVILAGMTAQAERRSSEAR
ncbi:TetR family transcriptional regulator [Streptomyces sp. 846.5]|nr:TetR/AcrR family transcriptional regulator [Streptomyces sp. 846.5]TDU02347.1 TetR family transcriptional regulator [Streptomyces sp. 846.5]